MFGMKMKPEQIFSILKGFNIDINQILPEIEKAILDEAIKIKQQTGKKPFLVAMPINDDRNIQITIYTEGEKPGDLEPHQTFPFSKILSLLGNLENQQKNIKNEIASNINSRVSRTINAPTYPDADSTGGGDIPGIEE